MYHREITTHITHRVRASCRGAATASVACSLVSDRHRRRRVVGRLRPVRGRGWWSWSEASKELWSTRTLQPQLQTTRRAGPAGRAQAEPRLVTELGTRTKGRVPEPFDSRAAVLLSESTRDGSPLSACNLIWRRAHNSPDTSTIPASKNTHIYRRNYSLRVTAQGHIAGIGAGGKSRRALPKDMCGA